MNNAEEIYKSITDPKSLIELATQSGKEDLFIDFKSVPKSVEGIFCESCKKNLGKGLSGFANSSGGVLVFGVKEVSGTFSLDAISEVIKFDQKIQEFINRLTAYNVPGVVSKVINEDQDKGYVVVLIPRSDLAPHQLIEDKKYYRRSGESFKPMEHYELENMFGRSPKPVLVPDIVITSNGSTGTHQDYKVVIGLRNVGRIAATYPYLGINLKNGYAICSYELDGNGNRGLPKVIGMNSGGGHFREYGCDGNYIVFPGQFLKVTSAKLSKDKRTDAFNLGDFCAVFKSASREAEIKEEEIKIAIDEMNLMIQDQKSYFEIKNGV